MSRKRLLCIAFDMDAIALLCGGMQP